MAREILAINQDNIDRAALLQAIQERDPRMILGFPGEGASPRPQPGNQFPKSTSMLTHLPMFVLSLQRSEKAWQTQRWMLKPVLHISSSLKQMWRMVWPHCAGQMCVCKPCRGSWKRVNIEERRLTRRSIHSMHMNLTTLGRSIYKIAGSLLLILQHVGLLSFVSCR